MHPTEDFTQLAEFYADHLHTALLPFWLTRSIDEEHGGYFTCFDNTGRQLLSEEKFTWSQGRMVWVLSKLATMGGSDPRQQERVLRLAKLGADFLMDHCLLDNGHCTFLMDRQGTPKPQTPGEGCDTSVFADCFVILGLSRYAAAQRDSDALAFARQLYRSVLDRLASGIFRTEPYPIPSGYKAHSIPMIMLHVSQELSAALRQFGDPESAEVDRRADAYMHEIMDHFVVPSPLGNGSILHEMIDTENRLVTDTLLGRHVNPGHTLEDMWFVMHQARARGDNHIIQRVAGVIKGTFEVGWDREYGGLLLFVDQDGGQPRGSATGMENVKMVQKVRNDWSNKLWWPHSEALYTTLLASTLTADQELVELYEKVHEYTFRTFPNPDTSIGEWIQIRDRQGVPEQKVVALPVKDPYHIIRNVILILEILQDAPF